MNGWLHSRPMRGAVVALIAVWMVAVTAAGAAVTPAMHCHGINMPCCPPSDDNSARCSGTQCVEQIPQKSEAAVKTPALQSAAADPIALARAVHAPARELRAGSRFPASVFRLKDDFRI